MLKTLFGLLGLFILVSLAWRLASGRRSLPCPSWLRWLVELDNPFCRTGRAAVILSRLDLRPGLAVLDAGCGPGRLTIPAAGSVGPQGQVTALDIQRGMLERVRARARAEGLENITLIEAGAGQGRLERGRFDRALLVTVLGEIPQPEAALKEIFDSLKPGGVLSVTELIFDPHFQPRGKVARLAVSAGFRQRASFGGSLAYTLNFEKPTSG
ncbi:methyltransferase domain-containing protein [bacterium]|nr:methyltransferase domain-containing protein [bacterium]